MVRPLAAWVGLAGSRLKRPQRALIGWFGVRGAGSVYYLAYALSHGVPGPLGEELTRLTLTVVAASVVAHGVSVTPLMNLYGRTRASAREGERPGAEDHLAAHR